MVHCKGRQAPDFFSEQVQRGSKHLNTEQNTEKFRIFQNILPVPGA